MPETPPVTEIVKKINEEADRWYNNGKTRLRIFKAFLAYEWVRINIVPCNTRQPYSPVETLRRRSGNCLSNAILLCSILRKNGFSDAEVYVAIGRSRWMKKVRYHSWVQIELASVHRSYILDPTLNIFKICNRDDIGLICVFNDRKAELFDFEKQL